MITFLALLFPPAQAAPAACLTAGVPMTCFQQVDPDSFCTYTLTPALGTVCIELSGPRERLQVRGEGDLIFYAADSYTDPIDIEQLVVRDGAQVTLWDATPDDPLPAFEIASGSDAASVIVRDDASLTLHGTWIQGAQVGNEPDPGIRGSAMQVLNDATVTMRGGGVSDGRGQLGGAVHIQSDASASFTNVDFVNNQFAPDPLLPAFYGEYFKGRDIYSLGHLELRGTNHTGPSSQIVPQLNSYGGSVYVGGTATLGTAAEPSTFVDYTAGTGGAIMIGSVDAAAGVDCSDVTVHADITNTGALLDGGAIAAANCDTVSYSGQIVSTLGAQSGAGLWFLNLDAATISNAEVRVGVTPGDGGGVYAQSVAELTLDDVAIIGNGYSYVDDAWTGGGVSAFDSDVEVRNSRFGPLSAYQGGAVYAWNGDVTVSNTLFTGAQATFGAAVAVENGNLDVIGSVVCESGQSGSVLDVESGTASIVHSWVEGSGSLDADDGTADHLTIAHAGVSPFEGSWDVSNSIVDSANRSAGDVTSASNSLFANTSSPPAGATLGPVAYLPTYDGHQVCGDRFRLDYRRSDAAAEGSTDAVTDDWGAFGVTVGQDVFQQLLSTEAGDPAIDWALDQDSDLWANAVDCDMYNPQVHPGAPEMCDGLDNDCDGQADGDDLDTPPIDITTWYRDEDGDSYGDENPATAEVRQQCVSPGDGWITRAGDCDDENTAINTGTAEVCGDGLDNDCDGSVDELEEGVIDAVRVHLNPDGDPYVVDASEDQAVWICAGDYDPSTMVFTEDAVGGDCDEDDPTVYPNAQEICDDGIPQDCNLPGDLASQMYWPDADNDGFGTAANEPGEVMCPWPSAPTGFATNDDDCNDDDATVNPDVSEVCGDDIDNDCDLATDDLDEATAWFLDSDSDGYGDPYEPHYVCPGEEAPDNAIDNDLDCDDSTDSKSPGNSEVCGDDLDNDCDPTTSDDGQPWYADRDGDGFGDPKSTVLVCNEAPPADHVTNRDDCDDTTAARAPGLPETCGDDLDNDCDGLVDDEDDDVMIDGDYYVDLDADGFGNDPIAWCRTELDAFTAADVDLPETAFPNARLAEVGDDCDDTNPAVNPDAPEIADNGVDEDCDGVDQQRYAAGGCTTAGTDGWRPMELLRRRR